MDKFVFISYKSDDREQIQPYIAMLKSLGVNYWWDQQIDQEWGRDIDAKLDACAAVIGFLTERSTNSSPVYEECRTGVAQNKFIPVKLDRSSMRYDFRSLIAFLNHIDLSGNTQEKNEAEKARLIQKIAKFVGKPLQGGTLPATLKEPHLFNLEKWITDTDRLPHIAYLVSLCFFEGQSHDRIQMCASLLEQQFTEHGLDKLLRLNSSLTIKQAKLKLLGAESVNFRSETLQQEVDFIQFENHLFNEELLFYIWGELDQLKTPIIRWIEELVERMPECINDIASSLSKIGRRNFLSIYSIFLHRWLCSKPGDKFRCADLTLSLMAGDTNVRSFIRDRLFDVSDAASSVEAPTADAVANLSTGQQSGADKSKPVIEYEIAVTLVTGFTGMAMPDLALHVFKELEANLMDPAFEPEKAKRIERRMREGIKFILVRSKTDPYAKAMLNVFATGIKSWALDDVKSKRTLLPEFIFNLILSGLSVGPRGNSNTIALADLLSEAGELEPGTVDAFSMVIKGALESGNAPIREMYMSLFKEWVAKLAKGKSSTRPDEELESRIEADRRAFESLFRATLRHASTDNDKDRIRFLCKSICTL